MLRHLIFIVSRETMKISGKYGPQIISQNNAAYHPT
jgi:hypothetical protein